MKNNFILRFIANFKKDEPQTTEVTIELRSSEDYETLKAKKISCQINGMSGKFTLDDNDGKCAVSYNGSFFGKATQEAGQWIDTNIDNIQGFASAGYVGGGTSTRGELRPVYPYVVLKLKSPMQVPHFESVRDNPPKCCYGNPGDCIVYAVGGNRFYWTMPDAPYNAMLLQDAVDAGMLPVDDDGKD